MDIIRNTLIFCAFELFVGSFGIETTASKKQYASLWKPFQFCTNSAKLNHRGPSLVLICANMIPIMWASMFPTLTQLLLLPVCHAEHASPGVLQFRMNFVGKVFPVNACTAPGMRGNFEWYIKSRDNSHQKATRNLKIDQPASACRISPLDHELLYHPMKLCTVVVTPPGKLRKISVSSKV